jgi:hypothetical protein
MEPFTMMLGYGLINSLSQLVVRPIADKMTASGRQAEMQKQMETKHALDLEAVRLNKQIELDNQFNIQGVCHTHRMQEAQAQFERQLKMWQIGQFNDKMWPLLTPFDHPSLRPQCIGATTPVNIFLAKTDPHSPFAALIQPDLKNRLSNFIGTAYSSDPKQAHSSICRIGDWKDGFQDAAFINALWFGLQGQPTIIINPIQSEFGEILDLNVSIWGLGETGHSPSTSNVISGHFGSAIGRLKREETRTWIEHGLPVTSPEMRHNADLLRLEEELIASGKGEYIDELLVQYKLPKEIQNKVITSFSSEYNHLVSCITGMFADIYHLIEYGAQPYMPIAINKYYQNSDRHFQIPDIAINHYRHALRSMTCTDYLQDKLPFAFLGVAKSLSYNPSCSQQILQEGIGLWANRKLDVSQEVAIPESIDECVRMLRDNSSDSDKCYLENAKDVLLSINQIDAAKSLDKKIAILIPSLEPTTTPEPNNKVEWDVIQKDYFTDTDFTNWISDTRNSAKNRGAEYAIILLREKFFAMLYLDRNYNIIKHVDVPGQCIVAGRFYLPQEIYNDYVIAYKLNTNEYITNFDLYMEKKEFDSFEKLGKQLDALINNLGSLSRPTRIVKQNNTPEKNDLERQLTQVFTSNNYILFESERCEKANFIAIKNWITSKLPVPEASNAHLFKTGINGQVLIGIFFSDADYNTLIGDKYPMKRIICNTCDSEIEAFLNGLALGTINI